MKTVVRNPTAGVYSATSDYVHALEVQGAQRLLFVAGTMGLDAAGVPGKTLEEQLDLIWSNLRAILASAGMTVDNIVRLTSYLTDPAGACPRAGLQPDPGPRPTPPPASPPSAAAPSPPPPSWCRR